MSNILFIVPPEKSIFENPPVGSLLLATILKENGLSSEILPLPELSNPDNFDTYLENIIKTIANKSPKIVSFYTRCDVYHIMLKISEKLKKQFGNTIVFGGPQSDIIARETIEAFPYVDYVCQGEGETTIVPFFTSLLQGKPDLTVPGLVYRQRGSVHQNERPALITDLDALPDIDYSIIGMSPENNANYISVDIGRGCPFGCSYCSTSAFWGRKFRLKSPERIRKEVESINKTYGVSKFSFMHDMFTFNRKMITAICKELKQLDFPITWSCSARIDCVDNEMIDLMVDAGMRNAYFGIETGSKRMQKLIHKNLNLDLVLPRMKYNQSKNIHSTASFIFGFPEETHEDLSQTLYMISELAKLESVTVQTHLCAFLPGTELSSRYCKETVLANYYSDISGSVGVNQCRDLITAHPEVFPQFREYQTELRKKLEHFTLFVNIWLVMQPVYQYIADGYDKNHLIDMYFDFLEENSKVLNECKDFQKNDQFSYLLKYDSFTDKKIPEDLKETVSECRRMAIAQYSSNLSPGEETIEIFSFSPKEFQRGSDLTVYRKQPTIARYQKLKNGKVEIKIGEL